MTLRMHNVSVRFGSGTVQRFRKQYGSNRLAFVTTDDFLGEVSRYLTGHLASGIRFDTECAEIVYDDTVSLLLRCEHGEWIITDITVSNPAHAFHPMYIWKRIWNGIRYAGCKFLLGWSIDRSDASCVFCV